MVVTQMVLKPMVSVGWLDKAAELKHATSFLYGLRYRHLKARAPRLTWIDRLFAWAGFAEVKESWIRAHEQEASLCLEGVLLYRDHAQALEAMAEAMIERGGAVR